MPLRCATYSSDGIDSKEDAGTIGEGNFGESDVGERGHAGATGVLGGSTAGGNENGDCA